MYLNGLCVSPLRKYTSRIQRRAGEPPCAVALRSLTDCSSSHRSLRIFPPLVYAHQLLLVELIKTISMRYQSGWAEGGDSSGNSTCLKTRRKCFSSGEAEAVPTESIRPERSRTAIVPQIKQIITSSDFLSNTNKVYPICYLSKKRKKLLYI